MAIKGLTVFFVLGGLVFAAEGKGASATKPKQEKTFYISVMWGQIDGKNSLELAEKVDANNAKIKKTIEIGGGIGGGIISILGTISVISAPLALTGALLSFAPSLVSLLSDKTEAKNSVISIFNKLLEN